MQFVVHLVGDSAPKRWKLFSLWPPHSADLEITVQLLVQVDKLVQLIESPVFTCEASVPLPLSLANQFHLRPPTTTVRAREIPTLVQMFVRAPHATPPKLRFPRPSEPPRRRQLRGLPAHSTKVVSSLCAPSPLCVKTHHNKHAGPSGTYPRRGPSSDAKISSGRSSSSTSAPCRSNTRRHAVRRSAAQTPCPSRPPTPTALTSRPPRPPAAVAARRAQLQGPLSARSRHRHGGR